MKSIALRFSENFSPKDGTIAEHQKIIDQKGYAFYGKMGSSVSKKNRDLVLSEEYHKILLIHSGGIKRYWAYIDKIVDERPPLDEFPAYYHDIADKFKTWFRITRFEEAPRNVLALCTVSSSGAILSEASRHSMSPYFLIDCEEITNE